MPESHRKNSTSLRASLPQSQQERRQLTAQLLEAVLEEAIEPRMAINRWPESLTAPDASLDCAYRILWHFEADEVQQKTEVFYLDAQLELLRQVAQSLKLGQDLPPHILHAYNHRPAVRFYQAYSVWMAARHYVASRWGQCRQIFSTAWALLHSAS